MTVKDRNSSVVVHAVQEVACSVVTSGDNCWVRLFDKQSGNMLVSFPLGPRQSYQ